jgi:hypothetical protein
MHLRGVLMGRSGGFTRREAADLAKQIQSHGWTVKEQTRPNHYLAYPPEGRPVGFSVSGDMAARRNVYAAFRRSGLELDPTRLARAS